jgi:hypothetical protein
MYINALKYFLNPAWLHFFCVRIEGSKDKKLGPSMCAKFFSGTGSLVHNEWVGLQKRSTNAATVQRYKLAKFGRKVGMIVGYLFTKVQANACVRST